VDAETNQKGFKGGARSKGFSGWGRSRGDIRGGALNGFGGGDRGGTSFGSKTFSERGKRSGRNKEEADARADIQWRSKRRLKVGTTLERKGGGERGWLSLVRPLVGGGHTLTLTVD